MSAIDAMTPPRATVLGFLLSAVNPKNLAMCVAAGVAVAGGSLSGGGTAVVLITHDRDIAALLPRQVRMRDGRVVHDDARAEAAR